MDVFSAFLAISVMQETLLVEKFINYEEINYILLNEEIMLKNFLY